MADEDGKINGPRGSPPWAHRFFRGSLEEAPASGGCLALRSLEDLISQVDNVGGFPHGENPLLQALLLDREDALGPLHLPLLLPGKAVCRNLLQELVTEELKQSVIGPLPNILRMNFHILK